MKCITCQESKGEDTIKCYASVIYQLICILLSIVWHIDNFT